MSAAASPWERLDEDTSVERVLVISPNALLSSLNNYILTTTTIRYNILCIVKILVVDSKQFICTILS